MSLTDFFAKLKRYDENANIIFDDDEPIGHATDLVMPRKHWFRRPAPSGPDGSALRSRCREEEVSPPVRSAAKSKRL